MAFPTADGTEAARWCPDGRGTGTHLERSSLAVGASNPPQTSKKGSKAALSRFAPSRGSPPGESPPGRTPPDWRTPETAQCLERPWRVVDLERQSQRVLVDTDDARATSVIRLPKFLSPEEIQSIHTAAARVKPTARAAPHGQYQDWQTTYLHTGGMFATCCGALYEKLLSGLDQADCEEGAKDGAGVDGDGWGVLRRAVELNRLPIRVRTIEYHEVGPGGALSSLTHCDTGSLITMDVMLADPAGGDFTGGEFHTLLDEETGEYETHTFEQGDALVFLSHKNHSVHPVSAGRRRVLVLEVWQGEERWCPHRCCNRWGDCNYGRDADADND